jgi:hypothetical protein
MQKKKNTQKKVAGKKKKRFDYPRYLERRHALAESILIILKRASKEISMYGKVSERTMRKFDRLKEEKERAPPEVKEAIYREIAFAKQLIKERKVRDFLDSKKK